MTASDTVEAQVDGLAVHALLLDTDANESLVDQGVVDAIKALGTPVFIVDIETRTLAPIGGKNFTVCRAVTFEEVVLSTSQDRLCYETCLAQSRTGTTRSTSR